MSVLRPYQADLIDKIRARMRAGIRSLLVTSPTGSGKTLLTAHMLKTASDRGKKCWFVVHRKELVEQSIAAFKEVGIDCGVVAQGHTMDPAKQVQIASILTLANRLDLLAHPDLIVWDECHHNAAISWSKVHEEFPKAYHVGLTATPLRLDGKGLRHYFSEIIEGPSVAWLIENEYLSPYKIFAPSSPDLSKVHKRAGDYVAGELTEVMNKPAITGSAINEYQKLADGKRAVIFCVTIQHSLDVVAEFNLSLIHI